jgi:DNA repair protein RadC
VRGLLSAERDALRQLGVGPAEFARLQAVAELCRLWTEERPVRGAPFTQGRDFYEAYYLRLRDLKQEAFIVVMLDQKNHAIAEQQVSAGSLTETLVHPREVFTLAIAKRAASVAVVHNHPSGDPAPSAADKAITKRLASVAQLVGIRLLDHVIVGEDGYYSFSERGALHA